MSRIAVIRRAFDVERVACVLPGPIRSLGRRGTANPASDSELERALLVIGARGGAVTRDPRYPGAFFLDPSAGVALYGGLAEWARTLESYLRGRGYAPSIVVGASRATAFDLACVKGGVTLLGPAGPAPTPKPPRRQPLLPGIRVQRRRAA